MKGYVYENVYLGNFHIVIHTEYGYCKDWGRFNGTFIAG